MDKPEVLLYTDGSCPVPHKAGGWAYILRIASTGTETRGSGGVGETTNNRMELQAVIEGLGKLPRPCSVTLCSDSQYVTEGISRWLKNWKKANWKKKDYETKMIQDVKNIDLWKALDKLLATHDVKVSWTRGHSGHVENEWCDQAAGRACKEFRPCF